MTENGNIGIIVFLGVVIIIEAIIIAIYQTRAEKRAKSN